MKEREEEESKFCENNIFSSQRIFPSTHTLIKSNTKQKRTNKKYNQYTTLKNCDILHQQMKTNKQKQKSNNKKLFHPNKTKLLLYTKIYSSSLFYTLFLWLCVTTKGVCAVSNTIECFLHVCMGELLLENMCFLGT